MQEIPNLIERIINGFYGATSVQISAVKCLHAISRSVEQLRTVFMEKPVSRQLLQVYTEFTPFPGIYKCEF